MGNKASSSAAGDPPPAPVDAAAPESTPPPAPIDAAVSRRIDEKQAAISHSLRAPGAAAVPPPPAAAATPANVPTREESEYHYVRKANVWREPFPEHLRVAVFACGCFWGTEKAFWRLPGVYSTAVGFIGGTKRSPSYREACSGRTGHTEATQVVYDPSQISFADLLLLFWR